MDWVKFKHPKSCSKIRKALLPFQVRMSLRFALLRFMRFTFLNVACVQTCDWSMAPHWRFWFFILRKIHLVSKDRDSLLCSPLCTSIPVNLLRICFPALLAICFADTCSRYYGRASLYNGRQNVTSSGRRCWTWASFSRFRSDFNYHFELNGAENFCRDPSPYRGNPWCVVGPTADDWEFCDIPSCQTYSMYSWWIYQSYNRRQHKNFVVLWRSHHVFYISKISGQHENRVTTCN